MVPLKISLLMHGSTQRLHLTQEIGILKSISYDRNIVQVRMLRIACEHSPNPLDELVHHVYACVSVLAVSRAWRGHDNLQMYGPKP